MPSMYTPCGFRKVPGPSGATTSPRGRAVGPFPLYWWLVKNVSQRVRRAFREPGRQFGKPRSTTANSAILTRLKDDGIVVVGGETCLRRG